MKHKIQNRFAADYVLMFLISTIIGIFAIMLLSFASDIISKNLIKYHVTAETIMKDDFNNIDTSEVLANSGGVQVINSDYEVVFSQGINTLPINLTPETFTSFLTNSHATEVPFSYSIAYNPRNNFWLVVTFPTSIRIDFAIVHNKDYSSVDTQEVAGVIVAIVLFYLILLGISTVIYSKLTSLSIINPLKKLYTSASRLKDGDYASRVDLNLDNEFGELERIFNEMADEIEKEIDLRKQSEENRKKLILDISHDLKNPLASIMGYAELCLMKPDLSEDQRQAYLKIIYDSSTRANRLMTDLFDLSKMETSEYILNKESVDLSEYLRERMSESVSSFDEAGFSSEFHIPDREIVVSLDKKQMNRVLENLVDNALSHNKSGTHITLELIEKSESVEIRFKDNGVGISPDLSETIFLPFVKGDPARHSESGGTGLGLAIVKKIMIAHDGSITLSSDKDSGCEFILSLPKS
ncbi:HAMP domain-containing sensor histidine kinase [Acetobacterium bakii]|uniref:HAMP domain-containing sensor histidine kinase n=1 Tax=Acetobacterium bakii TaxID=52689 RepID=UPI000682F260|nr:HAMP domain-containing sensor histidine kinase [Acetobacterium bakii]